MRTQQRPIRRSLTCTSLCKAQDSYGRPDQQAGSSVAPTAGLSDFIRRKLERVNPDNVSKVADPDTGEPLVVYHGTTAGNIEQFLPNGGNPVAGAKSLALFRDAQAKNERFGYMNFRSGGCFCSVRFRTKQARHLLARGGFAVGAWA